MINDNIVVLRKEEYEILTQDSILANLTRKFLQKETSFYPSVEPLRFIYQIPRQEEDT